MNTLITNDGLLPLGAWKSTVSFHVRARTLLTAWIRSQALAAFFKLYWTSSIARRMLMLGAVKHYSMWSKTSIQASFLVLHLARNTLSIFCAQKELANHCTVPLLIVPAHAPSDASIDQLAVQVFADKLFALIGVEHHITQVCPICNAPSFWLETVVV